MGKNGFDLKKILSNKNTVTVLAVFIGVVILYFAYNYRVKQAIKPISVPSATKTITANTVITDDMIEYVEITSSLKNKSPNLITNAAMISGKKVKTGTSIPTGGLFYTDQLVSSTDNYDNDFADIKDGYTIFALEVNNESTYGNSIYPGNYIDLYLEAMIGDKLVYGKFIESIEVLDVRDQSGNHVFDGGDSIGEPNALLFAVPDEMHLLLNIVVLNGFKLHPVPRNASYSLNPSATEVSSEFLESYVLSKSAVIPD